MLSAGGVFVAAVAAVAERSPLKQQSRISLYKNFFISQSAYLFRENVKIVLVGECSQASCISAYLTVNFTSGARPVFRTDWLNGKKLMNLLYWQVTKSWSRCVFAGVTVFMTLLPQ